MYPIYSRAEQTADAIVHFVGILFGVIGGSALILASLENAPASQIAGVSVYSAGLIAMFTASASYNFSQKPAAKEWLRRLDHAVIFIMIAGSYTPFAVKIGGQAGAVLLLTVWAIALLGMAAKLLFPRKLDKISVLLYLAQGWCILFAMGPLIEAVPAKSLYLLLIGGCIYSLGVIFHLLERMPFHNVIWHIFVLAGAIVQYMAIYLTVIARY